jgi:hypothetical protein
MNDLDYSYFYETLHPYGAWVRYSPYGYVWIPRDIGYRWRPYSRGHWLWTDYGWHWVSAERWGWLVYHYGRWGFDRRLGWFWVPDTFWGPSWVVWRTGDLYLGWAPIPPGIDLRPGVGYGRWNNVRIPGDHWVFVRGGNFLDSSLDRWILPFERNVTIVNMTVIHADIQFRGNRAVNAGMGREVVQRATNRSIDRYELKDAKRAEENRVEGREVVIFRPEISKNELARPKEPVETEEARQEIERGELGSLVRRKSVRDEAEIADSHKRESVLLQESQEEEVSLIRRQAEEKSSKASSPEEKKKIQSQFNSRISEIRKKHEQEKAELAKRQKEEKEAGEKAAKPPVKKKIIRD